MSHPNDDPFWYRLALNAWRGAITISAMMSLAVALIWLNDHGNLTAEAVTELNTAFTIVGHGVLLGILLVAIGISGPNWVHQKATAGLTWAYQQVVRGEMW